MSININDVWLDTMKATGLSQKELAMRMHVTQAAITNWISRGVPQDKLIPMAMAIGNKRFVAAAVEFQTGLRVFDDDLTTDDPLVIFMRVSMATRHYDSELESSQPVLSKDCRSWNGRDIQVVRKYLDALESLIESLESQDASISSKLELREVN
jgi:transcriptional regulator with XRE-family HTH domain